MPAKMNYNHNMCFQTFGNYIPGGGGIFLPLPPKMEGGFDNTQGGVLGWNRAIIEKAKRDIISE